MKEKVKIWSRRRLLGAFLAFLGLSAVATAQNGTVNANCAILLKTYNRTIIQMDSANGTVIPIDFNVGDNNNLIGDEYYIVAEINGSLLSLTNNSCTSIGAGLELRGTTTYTTDDGVTTETFTQYNRGDGDLGNAVGTIPGDGKVYVNVKAKTPGSLNDGNNYKLGIFVKDMGGDDPTSCFSDVYWIEIIVGNPIYASLTLRDNQYANEYICSGATTRTNLGFSLCNVPVSGGKLVYTVQPTFTSLSGMSIATTGTHSDAIVLTPSESEISTYVSGIEINSGSYTLAMGTQTISNASSNVANTVTYEFVEGLDKFYYEYTVTEDDQQRTIKLPIVFITDNKNCTNTEQEYSDEEESHIFTVHVAPNFGVQALAYAQGGTTPYEHNTADAVLTTTPELINPKFCQGTLAYLFGETTASEGITTYTWSNYSPLELTGGANIQNPTTSELVIASVADAAAYTLGLEGNWNNDGLYNRYNGDGTLIGAGCIATDQDGLPIIVTPAPILLLATDKSGEDAEWNTTEQITAPLYCPGNQIMIHTSTADGLDENDNVIYTDEAAVITARNTYMTAGNYINANGNTISYTVSNTDDLKAYSNWRTTEVLGGNIEGNATANVKHYLDNTSSAEGYVTYTVYSAGSCALVKSNGMPLTNTVEVEGVQKPAVQIKYPVSPRPTFTLGAN